LKKIVGVTLLEIMLVLAIAAAIMSLVLVQYDQAAKDNSVREVQISVETLFLGLGGYFKANCKNTQSSSRSLNPANSPATPFPVNSGSQSWLTTDGYLTSKQWPPIPNGLVDATVGDHGFFAQFNQMTVSNRSPSASYNAASYNNWVPGGAQTTPSLTNTGQVYMWRAQVSVKLADSLLTNISTYKNRLAADCVSDLSSDGETVEPCSASKPGAYLVWERLPSYSTPQAQSSYWLTMPRIKQFNQLYTNDDMYGAYNTSWTDNVYLCGG
jgi:hypothetical protein